MEYDNNHFIIASRAYSLHQPVVENFGVVVLWLICYFLLVSYGLLLACPSPPGSASGGFPLSS
jgi:hypothetical protein